MIAQKVQMINFPFEVSFNTYTYYYDGNHLHNKGKPMFKPHLNLSILFVSNPQNSALFYQDLLGLKPIESSLTFVMFALPNQVSLGLWSKHTAEPTVKSDAGAIELCFPTEDIDALYDKWGDKPLVVLQKPTDMDFGRTFVIADPDGHRLRFYKFHEA